MVVVPERWPSPLRCVPARKAATLAGIGPRLVERLIAPDDAGYVASLSVRWREALANAKRPPEHLVLSFHGIPVRYNRREQGIYVRDCEATTRAFLAAIEWPLKRATLVYQSRLVRNVGSRRPPPRCWPNSQDRV